MSSKTQIIFIRLLCCLHCWLPLQPGKRKLRGVVILRSVSGGNSQVTGNMILASSYSGFAHGQYRGIIYSSICLTSSVPHR